MWPGSSALGRHPQRTGSPKGKTRFALNVKPFRSKRQPVWKLAEGRLWSAHNGGTRVRKTTAPRRALQLLGWYAILLESSGLSVARRLTKTNQNLNHDLRFRLDRCLADPSRNHPALRHRITSATRQTP